MKKYLGSEVVTLKHTDANRLRCKYNPCQVRLRVFGGGECLTIGRCEYTIRVDGIEIQTEIFIVPDDCQADTIIIGRSALDQPNIKVTKERQTLTIEKIRGKWRNEENDPIEHEKEIQLLLEEDNGLDRNNNTHELEKMDDTESPVTNIESMYEEEQVDGGPRKTMDMSYAINPNLAEEDIAQLQSLIRDNEACFANCFGEIGVTDKVKIDIELTSSESVTCKPYRLPYAQRDIVKQTVDELLQAGIVRASNSAYASHVFMRKNQEWECTPNQEEAFQNAKDVLTQRPVLALYNPEATFEVHTDASKSGLAGILLQRMSDTPLEPVAYFSRQTSDIEERYHSYELETLAVVDSVERFRIYLLGRKFKVVTDCNSLKTVMKKRDLTPRIARWVLRLQEYDFDIEHRGGGHTYATRGRLESPSYWRSERIRRGSSDRLHVDALSRHPTGEAKESDAAALTVLSVRIDEDYWLITMQLQDPKLVEIRNTLARQPQNNTEKQMHTDYKLDRNRLYRKTESGTKWVVPKGIRWRVIKGCHDDMGHFGYDKTLEQLKQYYWFPKMAKKVRSYLSSCIECAYHKGKAGKPEGQLYNIERVPIPFHTAHIDHLGLFPKSSKGNTYVLAYIDNFTKFMFIKAVKDTKTNNVIKMLADVFSVFGPPHRLISDRGTAFTSKTFESFCIDNDITHIKNATATPRANGQIERYNGTLMAAITTTYTREDGLDWDSRLQQLQYALNGTINKTTGQSAHTLLLGYKPRNALQNKLVLALSEEEPGNLDEIRGEALKKIQCMQEKQKEYFDKHHRPARHYQSGDLVLIYREPTATGSINLPRTNRNWRIEKAQTTIQRTVSNIQGSRE
ncbi:Integrase core domain [Popillia japonica]|uniref:RNA-directed DNA polymerase n=1 Tax=Popillia japonica TaxID=7064 RepID=A0AAW1JFW5_POPJA